MMLRKYLKMSYLGEISILTRKRIIHCGVSWKVAPKCLSPGDKHSRHEIGIIIGKMQGFVKNGKSAYLGEISTLSIIRELHT